MITICFERGPRREERKRIQFWETSCKKRIHLLCVTLRVSVCFTSFSVWLPVTVRPLPLCCRLTIHYRYVRFSACRVILHVDSFIQVKRRPRPVHRKSCRTIYMSTPRFVTIVIFLIFILIVFFFLLFWSTFKPFHFIAAPNLMIAFQTNHFQLGHSYVPCRNWNWVKEIDRQNLLLVITRSSVWSVSDKPTCRLNVSNHFSISIRHLLFDTLFFFLGCLSRMSADSFTAVCQAVISSPKHHPYFSCCSTHAIVSLSRVVFCLIVFHCVFLPS